MICSVRCYVILLEKGTYSLIIKYMFKKWFQSMLRIDENLWFQKSRLSNCSCTHSTPHTNLKITSWHSMDYNVVLCRPVRVILIVRKSKLPNECMSIFSNICPLKVPVHKIQFYLALSIMELGNQMRYMAATAVLLDFVLRTQVLIGCAIHARWSTGGLQASASCVVSLQHLSSACTLLPKNEPIIWNLFTYLFSSMKLVNPEIVIWITTLRKYVFIICNVTIAYELQRPHILSINPLPSLTLQSARNLNVACRTKRSKALLLSSS